MGWYLRKSVKFGQLRVNFSKSGIGYSFGVKGARIGTGPRGPYIAGGRYGIYYRQSLKAHAPAAAPPLHALVAASGNTYCTQCGAAVLAGNNFCIRCGCRATPDVTGVAEEKHDHHLSWVLLAALAIVVVCVPFLASLDSTKPAVSSSASTPAIQKPAVPFSVEQKTSGKPVAVWLPPNSTDEQLRELVQYFRLELQSQKFTDLGINAPTSVLDYASGTVLFYRETATKQGAVKKAASRVAEYKWGIDGNFEKDSGRIWLHANGATNLF
jgi:hypothetical protein